MKDLLQTVKRQAVQNGIELKTFDNEYTRKTASILSTLALIKQDTALTSENIDNECFNLFSFTLSNNKTIGKSKSNLLKRRLPKYINNQLFAYDALSDNVILSESGAAILLKGKREVVGVDRIRESVKRVKAKKLIEALHAKVTFKGRKSILTKADHKKVSNMLFNHLSIA